MHLRLANRLGRAVLPRRLEAEALLDAAAERAGSDDFGEGHEPGFRRLVESLNEEAALNPVGYVSARTYLVSLLENRARLAADRRRHPEIAAVPLPAPIVITGLPRSGSTLLFELMARDPALRAPLSWEVMQPSPPPRATSVARDPRIRRTARMLDQVERIAPRFKHIHALGARLPQECIAITAHAFRSIQFHTTNDVPGYQDWLDGEPLEGAYAEHRRFLQHLAAFGPPGRWLLKAPGHLFGIEALLSVYPDARIVHTHRDPLVVTASIASHCASLRQAFSERLDLPAIGRTWLRLWADALERTLDYRDRHPALAARFVDLDYQRLLADPLGAVERLYPSLDLSFGDAARSAMAAYLDVHPQHRHGRHRYRLEDFGLTAAEVRSRYRFYERWRERAPALQHP